MKQSINVYQFDDAFRDMGRQDNFSYQGRHALYEWIEQLDEDCGTETELDVVALCGEFTEYESLSEFQDNYGSEYNSLETISDHTIVIPIDDDSFIIQDF
jgi:hypothetical protein